MKKVSLDPRVSRLSFSENKEAPLKNGDLWETYEVFVQKKRGQQHQHAGIVHAPEGEMALVFAKEQFGRRGQVANIWVVASSAVHALEHSDDDIFSTTPEKLHREPHAYKVKNRIQEFLQRKKA